MDHSVVAWVLLLEYLSQLARLAAILTRVLLSLMLFSERKGSKLLVIIFLFFYFLIIS
jgi:hypothetical protein